jgi:hypothetical protein
MKDGSTRADALFLYYDKIILVTRDEYQHTRVLGKIKGAKEYSEEEWEVIDTTPNWFQKLQFDEEEFMSKVFKDSDVGDEWMEQHDQDIAQWMQRQKYKDLYSESKQNEIETEVKENGEEERS